MGGSSYSRSDYDARATYRATTNTSAFVHDSAIKSGAVAASTHIEMDPLGVKLRESRDSDAHPISVPVAVIFDTTGSMMSVPDILQRNLNKLMGTFLDDKASGKKYLGEGYPSIFIGALDDFDAMSSAGHKGTLQIGQFESGIEIDDNLGKLWLTGRGGGSYEESYELALYFMARHTAHDHMDKRHKKGYLFLIGDEHAYSSVEPVQVKTVIGDSIQDRISFADILKEAKKLYHVFFVIPNLTHHYNDPELEKYWVDRVGQQNCIKLDDPTKICELIAGAVSICENYISMADLSTDGVSTGVSTALAKISSGALSNFGEVNLPPVVSSNPSSGTERI